MSDNKEKQALFMEALNELKEYAKVNGNIPVFLKLASCILAKLFAKTILIPK